MPYGDMHQSVTDALVFILRCYFLAFYITGGDWNVARSGRWVHCVDVHQQVYMEYGLTHYKLKWVCSGSRTSLQLENGVEVSDSA